MNAQTGLAITTIFFDLGNVIIPFDNGRLMSALTPAASSGVDVPRVWRRLLREHETGRLSATEFKQEYCRATDSALSPEAFRAVSTCHFAEFFRRPLRRSGPEVRHARRVVSLSASGARPRFAGLAFIKWTYPTRSSLTMTSTYVSGVFDERNRCVFLRTCSSSFLGATITHAHTITA